MPDMPVERIVDYDQRLAFFPGVVKNIIVGGGDPTKAVFASLIRTGDLWIKERYTDPTFPPDPSSPPSSPGFRIGDIWVNF